MTKKTDHADIRAVVLQVIEQKHVLISDELIRTPGR